MGFRDQGRSVQVREALAVVRPMFVGNDHPAYDAYRAWCRDGERLAQMFEAAETPSPLDRF